MQRVLWVARAELVFIRRSRIAVIGVLTMLALGAISVLTTHGHMSQQSDLRSRHQAESDAQFDAQPARHPHRMVHYGTYAHRPVGGLAAFDPGVDPYTGTVIYLEGHRQNSATFSEVREASGLLRFGQLTPAFVLNTLVPLLLVFIGFSMVSREREERRLTALYAHGARPQDIVLGKALSLCVVASIALFPALAALAWIAVTVPTEALAALIVGVAHVGYLVLWVIMIIAVSTLASSSRSSLLVLVAVWAIIVVLLPRLAVAMAGHSVPLPSKAQTELRLQNELRAIGDSHNPDDPYFADFRQRILDQYAVSRVEDLPFNYRGRLMEEGEALTSRLFEKYADEVAGLQRQQMRTIWTVHVLSPSSALRELTMTMAATDLDNHLEFLRQAEAYRYKTIQALNRLHSEALSAADDARRSTDRGAEQRTRIDAHHWSELDDFRFATASVEARVGNVGMPVFSLIAWLLIGMFTLRRAVHRLQVGTFAVHGSLGAQAGRSAARSV